MDLAALQRRLGELKIQPKDVFRASLYIDYLDHAQTYFVTTLAGTRLAGGFGDDYPFVEDALRSANLLQELADILDFYVSPAMNPDLTRAFSPPPGLNHGAWTYQDYFTNLILDANPVTFAANIQAFRTRYPIPAVALARLSANFEGNVFLACQRIIDDEAVLTSFYSDLYEDDFAILSLQKIKSTGSDFHKGGKQVLILTFDVIHTVDYGPPLMFAPARAELKVVYKPSDMEIDCLILGDSAVINRALRTNFMTASLFEIYNQRVQTMKTANPAFTGEKLATYRILPRDRTSIYVGGGPLPIRDAYGYIQYLDNDLTGTAQRIFGYYPFGASDFLIFQSQSPDPIIKSFYRQEGAITALCCSFSIMDMHIENVRVNAYRPYLIDLEISLTSAVADVIDASLVGENGGITGIRIEGQKFSWTLEDVANPGQANLQRFYPQVYYENRLWTVEANRRRRTVPVNGPYLMQGFVDGMSVLRACQQNSDFNTWFQRLDNVLVRYLPYPTPAFKTIQDAIFIAQLARPDPGAAFNPTQQAALRDFLTQQYTAYRQRANAAADPKFVALVQTVCGPDYVNLDIPVFYHRIGTTGIVDSQGRAVPIPATVTIDRPGLNPLPPTQDVDVTGVNGVFNRATFFATSPMQAIVQVGQVQILGGAGFGARQTLLGNSITTRLGNNANNPPSVIAAFPA